MNNSQGDIILLLVGVGIAYLLLALFLFDDGFSRKMSLVSSAMCLMLVILVTFVFPTLGIR